MKVAVFCRDFVWGMPADAIGKSKFSVGRSYVGIKWTVDWTLET